MRRVIPRIGLWQETAWGKELWLEKTGGSEQEYDEWLAGAHARYAEYMDERGFRYRKHRGKGEEKRRKRLADTRLPEPARKRGRKTPTAQMLQWEQEMLAKKR